MTIGNVSTEIEVNNVNGNIWLKNFLGLIIVHTINGNITSQKAGSSLAFTTLTEEGTYKIKLENWVNGKINGGSSEVLM